MAVRYEPDHKGTGELLLSPGMHKLVGQAADAGKTFAESISPDQVPYAEGYIASFEVERGLVSSGVSGKGTARATARLVNTSKHAAAVEWRHDHHVLARTADYLENAWVPGG